MSAYNINLTPAENNELNNSIKKYVPLLEKITAKCDNEDYYMMMYAILYKEIIKTKRFQTANEVISFFDDLIMDIERNAGEED